MCESLTEISMAELQKRVPIINPEQVARVLIEKDALSLDAHALLESFRRQLLDAGGRVLGNARVERIERLSAGWRPVLG